MTPTKKNKAADKNPCDSIWNNAPEIPSAVKEATPNSTKPICETEEYAIKRFKSFCANAFSAPYKIEITPINPNHQLASTAASGNILKQTRIIPYPPIFNKIPASIMETGVGASTWASGNHVCI